MKFKKDQEVVQVVPVIAGKVVKAEVVDDEVQYCVQYTDEQGEEHTRFFKENEIQAVTK